MVLRGRCPTCEAKSPAKQAERQRLTAHQRGYGVRWQRTSEGYLRAHPLCKDIYGVHGQHVVAATDTDHIVPHRGDMTLFWDPNNWQPLCKTCHSRKTASELLI